MSIDVEKLKRINKINRVASTPEEQSLTEPEQRILDFWNSKKIVRHRPTLRGLKRALERALKHYSEEEIIESISNYATVVHDINYKPFKNYTTYIWTLPIFLHSDALLNYSASGSRWINYCRNKGINLTMENNDTNLNLKDAPQYEPPSSDEEQTELYLKVLNWLITMPYEKYLHTEHWKHFRQQALINAGERCQICGDNRFLHVHHRTYENRGRETFLDVVVLCDSCHSKIHGKNA